MYKPSDKSTPASGRPKPGQQSSDNSLELDVEHLIDQQNGETETSSIRSEAAKTPQLDVETPAVSNPQQDDSIADLLDESKKSSVRRK